MNIVVLLKMVPDVVEELEIAGDGKSLDTEWLRMIPSEWCEHALEQALLLRESYGGLVVAVAFDAPEVDDMLFSALAKGADRVVKLTGAPESLAASVAAGLLAEFLGTAGLVGPDLLLLAGAQAIDDLQGESAIFVSRRLGLPYVGVVTGVALNPDGSSLRIRKEFAGGLRGEFEVPLPAVLGIQAAEKPPRYVPVAKVRAVMKEKSIEEVPIGVPEAVSLLEVVRMFKPEPTGRAEMLEGTPERIAERMVEILAEQGLV